MISCDEYLGDSSKVALVDGAAEAVARARKLGYATIVVSNQSGVARGYFSETAVHAVNQRMDELLSEGNPKAVIDRHEFCPFHPDASIEKYRSESPLRKPAPGMLLAAADALALDLSRSWLVGDAPRDVEAGAAAGCRTILVVNPALKQSPAALEKTKVQADYVCSSLGEAMGFIERNTERAAVEEELPATMPAPTPSPLQGEGRGEGRSVEETKSEVMPIESERRTLHPSPLPSRGEGTREEPSVAPVGPSMARLETLAEQILYETRRRHEQPHADFSVSKLMAGVVQVIVLFVLFLSYLNRDSSGLIAMLLFALTLQTMTIALLIMGRQR